MYTEEQVEIMYQVGIIEQYGASQKMFEEARKELSDHFGFQASVRDTIWKMMNTLLSRQDHSGDKERLWVRMGQFVEEEGKDPAPLIEQAMTLMEARVRREVHGLSKLSVRTCNDDLVCDSCKKASERVITRDEILEKMPIATGCLNPYGCRCWVVGEFDLSF